MDGSVRGVTSNVSFATSPSAMIHGATRATRAHSLAPIRACLIHAPKYSMCSRNYLARPNIYFLDWTPSCTLWSNIWSRHPSGQAHPELWQPRLHPKLQSTLYSGLKRYIHDLHNLYQQHTSQHVLEQGMKARFPDRYSASSAFCWTFPRHLLNPCSISQHGRVCHG